MSRRAILAAGLSVILVLIGAALVVLAVLRADVLTRAGENLKDLAAVMAEQMAQSVQSIEYIVGATARDVEVRVAGGRSLADPGLFHNMVERTSALTHVRNLLVVDRGGVIRVNTLGPGLGAIDVGDREYFRVHRERRFGLLHVGVPVVSRITGEAVQIFSRGVNDARGEFHGVVVATMRDSYFEGVFNALRLGGAGGRVMLFRNDGALLMTHPAAREWMGRSVADTRAFAAMRADPAGGVVRSASLLDDQPRLIAHRRVEGYPLIIAVSSTEGAVLASWRRDAWQIGAGAAGAAAVVGLALFLLLRQMGVSAGLQHEVVEAGERMQGIVQSAMDAIITINGRQEIVLFNAAAEKLFRCPAAEAVGGPLERFIPERFRAAHRAHVAAFGTTGATTRMMGMRRCLFGLRADGEEFPIDASISQVTVSGQHLYTVILRDVTERMAADVALERSHRDLLEAEGRLRAVFESAMDPIITLDEQHGIVMFNAAAEKVFGCPAAEAVGGSLDRFIPERFREAHRRHVADFGRTGVTTRRMGADLPLSGLRANGEEFPIDASISQVVVAGRKLYTVILRDVTDRRWAEAALREERDTAQRYLDIAGVMLLVLDGEGKVTLVNRKGCELLGCREDEIVGQSWFDRFLPERERDRVRELHRRILAGETTEFHENALLVRGGAERLIAWQNRVLTDEAGRITGTLSSGEDVTDRRRAEQALERSYHELRELSAAMHEVREAERLRVARELHDELAQWLTALKMDVSWLAARLPRELDPLVQKAEKMKTVVDTTVAAVRRIATDLRPVMLDDLGLAAAMESLLHDLSERAGLVVSFEAGEGALDFREPLASGIYRIAQEALTNVARHAEATQVDVALRLEDDHLVLRVRDNGRGFDPDTPRERKSYGILGIRERAHTLGGTARIARHEPGGTLVEVVIPVARYRKGEAEHDPRAAG